MVAFAANSILCRMALEGGTIDAASFASLRLTAGAAILLAIVRVRGRTGAERQPRSRTAAMALFLYAVPFSYAYLSLGAGTGALILFGAVQATMILAGLRSGERPRASEWVGLVVALAGLAYLVAPGLSAPSLAGAALMGLAGVAWGLYSLLGRGARDPIAATAGNFLRAVPFALAVSLLTLSWAHVSLRGAGLAVASGALASGLGYVVWYAALRGLTATRAAIVQLSVPVLAALAGAAFLAEVVTGRMALAAVLILGGVGCSLLGRGRGVNQ